MFVFSEQDLARETPSLSVGDRAHPSCLVRLVRPVLFFCFLCLFVCSRPCFSVSNRREGRPAQLDPSSESCLTGKMLRDKKKGIAKMIVLLS